MCRLAGFLSVLSCEVAAVMVVVVLLMVAAVTVLVVGVVETV